MKKLLLSLLLFSFLGAYAYEEGKFYTLRIGTRVVGIPDAVTANYTTLQLESNCSTDAQAWRVEEQEDGCVRLINAYTGYLLGSKTAVKKEGDPVVTRNRASKYSDWRLIPESEGSNYFYLQHVVDGEEGLFLGATANAAGAALQFCDRNTVEDKLVKCRLMEVDASTEFNAAERDKMFADFLKQYYKSAGTGHVLGNGGWWGDAEMFETLLDYFETTGDPAYKTYFSELYSNFNARNGNYQNWRNGWGYNDDITWYVLACIRAYKFFGITSYLTTARNSYDMMYERALYPSGMLRWEQFDPNHYKGTNSCINCPAIIAACYLYEMTGEEDYLTKAINLYAKQRQYLFNATTGEVWDSGNWNEDFTQFTVGNRWVSTYNQGTMLGAAVKLYNLTGERQYRDDATKVYNRAYSSLCNSEHIIHVCQVVSGDLCGFKGILMRYARMYAEDLDHPEALDWVKLNAWRAYQNRNNKGVTWSKWLTKTTDDFSYMDGDTKKYFNNDPFGASTALSAAANCHVNALYYKSAFDVIGAELFDDIKFAQIAAEAEDGDTPNTTLMTKNGYICFKHVDFGQGAEAVSVRVSGASSNSLFHIYLDRIDDDHLLYTSHNLSKGWETIDAAIPATTGSHTVYVVAQGASMKFHNIRFGLTLGIDEAPQAEGEKPSADSAATYNLAGQRVGSDYRGIVVRNGKKVWVR